MSDARSEARGEEIERRVECEDLRRISGLEETGSNDIDNALGAVIPLKPVMDDCCSSLEGIDAQGHCLIIA